MSLNYQSPLQIVCNGLNNRGIDPTSISKELLHIIVDIIDGVLEGERRDLTFIRDSVLRSMQDTTELINNIGKSDSLQHSSNHVKKLLMSFGDPPNKQKITESYNTGAIVGFEFEADGTIKIYPTLITEWWEKQPGQPWKFQMSNRAFSVLAW